MSRKQALYHIIFGTETPKGKRFDIFLLLLILVSVVLVMLESIPSLNQHFGNLFYSFEILFTLFFTLEYFLRIYISPKPSKYIFSFWGIIDLLSILPTYVGFFYNGYRFLRAIRIFRLLRAFKVLNLNTFIGESSYLTQALIESKNKIIVFLSFIITIVCCLGTVMYVIEGPENGFTSIPESIYWAIVTITTVGYGDIAPKTVLGKLLASASMIIGYAIIAIPTGIVVSNKLKDNLNLKKICKKCSSNVEQKDLFCAKCGNELNN